VAARKKLKRNKKQYELVKYILGVNIIMGILLLFSGLVSFEGILPYGQRWLPVFIFTAWIIFMLIAIWRWTGLKKIENFEDIVISERKQNWLKKAGKKK